MFASPARTLQISRRGRYEKCTIKPFEISIVIMSCLLSLESGVTFHTGESRGSLRREEESDCQANMWRIFSTADLCASEYLLFILQRFGIYEEDK